MNIDELLASMEARKPKVYKAGALADDADVILASDLMNVCEPQRSKNSDLEAKP